MNARSRVYLVGCAALIGYAIGYALPAYARLPSLYYDPLARRFLFGARPGPLPMGYLGQVIDGVLGGLVAASVVALATMRGRAEPGESSLGLAAAWALTALALVGAYFTWNNWP